MTLGYILVMVTILANGNVYGEALDYFTDQNDCIETAIYEKENLCNIIIDNIFGN